MSAIEFGVDRRGVALLEDPIASNGTAFYKVVTNHVEEMLPIVYTPTVGLACQQFSHIYRRSRGLFLSYPHQDRLAEILGNRPRHEVDAIVVTDGERILGLGVLAARARRVTDGMFDAAARALGELSPAASDPHASLLPRVAQLRAAAVHIASAVAIAAVNDGVAPAASDDELQDRVGASQWTPHYDPPRPATSRG